MVGKTTEKERLSILRQRKGTHRTELDFIVALIYTPRKKEILDNKYVQMYNF